MKWTFFGMFFWTIGASMLYLFILKPGVTVDNILVDYSGKTISVNQVVKINAALLPDNVTKFYKYATVEYISLNPEIVDLRHTNGHQAYVIGIKPGTATLVARIKNKLSDNYTETLFTIGVQDKE